MASTGELSAVVGQAEEALAELERHSTYNETLKAKATSEGWIWDLKTGCLYPTAKGGKASTADGSDANNDSVGATSAILEAAQEAVRLIRPHLSDYRRVFAVELQRFHFPPLA